MGEIVAKDEGVAGDGGSGARREGELEGVQVGCVCWVIEVRVGGGQGGGGWCTEGLKTHVKNCGCVCWWEVRKGR